MIEPYVAIALQPTFWGCLKRSDIKRNLKHICEFLDSRIYVPGIEFPVKLVALPELALQSMQSEAVDMDHVKVARELAIEIPGEETDVLADRAKQHNTFIIAQAKAVEPDFPDRFFSVAFLIDPRGKVVYKRHKTFVWVNENSVVPYDIWDLWVEKYGRSLDAFYPVADTEIGRIGALISMEGAYPENARGLAMNGAEIIYRPTFPGPWAAQPYGSEGYFALQNRARALDNTCYVIAPNMGPYFPNLEYAGPGRTDVGHSMIVGYKGQILSMAQCGCETYSAASINIQELREFRARSLIGNWLKDLRTEQLRLIYEKEIYPKNLWLKQPPGKHSEYRKIFKQQIKKLLDEGIWVQP